MKRRLDLSSGRLVAEAQHPLISLDRLDRRPDEVVVDDDPRVLDVDADAVNVGGKQQIGGTLHEGSNGLMR